MSIRIFFILGISICLAGLSCEKDAHIQMHQTDQSLVVEGTIENGKAPKVVLTHSLNYFSSIDAAILQGLFVHDAQINVSTPYQEVQLIEKEVDTLLGAKYYYYEPSNPNTFRGKIGRTYTLQIKIKGQTLKATTTIPAGGFILDTIWWAPGIKNKKPDSSKVFLLARIYDPQKRGDYARYFTKRNREPFYPGPTSVADDDITNGTIFVFQLPRGIPKSKEETPNDTGYFNRGDTVTLKFCNIDEATYQFWNTWEYAWGNNSNPFANPTIVKGNIPGALGYWGGYKAQYKTIIIPK